MIESEGPSSHLYWFAPKRVGLGWGLPVNGKGWTVLVGFLLIFCGLPFISETAFEAAAVPLLIAFIAVVFITGDPAGRHWRS